MDHIDAMDQLKHGIGLRAYGQRDPVVEYRMEGFDMLDEMIRNIQHDAVSELMRIRKENIVVQRTQVANPVTATHGGDDVTVRNPKNGIQKK